MYHAIVRRRIRALFDAVNRGDAEPVLRTFARRFEHSFLGEHAELSLNLGDERGQAAAV